MVGSNAERREGGFLERTLTRLVMRPARVVRAVELTPDFRLIDFQGEALKNCSWSPGDKVQIKLDSGFVTRTYTPIDWDRDEGRTRFLAYCHGTGPGSLWAKQVAAGDERPLFGPRHSLGLAGLSPSTVLVGDETSFALALALEALGAPAERRYCFEVNDRSEAADVLEQLGLPGPVLVERQADDAHLPRLGDAVLASAQPAGIFVLTGKASSIQHVSRTLKRQDVGTRRLRTKAYWAPGKTGLD